MSMQFDLNGKSVEVEPRDGESLLEVLRNRCGITSLKDGCAPQGQCGCCLAMVGGKAVVTCAIKAEKAAGKEVVTLDGLPDKETSLIADCFAASAGLQCGFCIPGLAMRAHHLIKKNPKPTRAEIAKAMNCRIDDLEFPVWFLRESGLIKTSNAGDYAITADGVQWVESGGVAHLTPKATPQPVEPISADTRRAG